MREPTRVRVCAVVMSLVAGVLLPMHAFAQYGSGPMPTPAPPQAEAPAPPTEPEPAEARPSRPNLTLMAFDLVIVRPLGFVAAAVGAVLFLPAALITSPMGRDSVEGVMEIFITIPSNDVFKRPLGEF